MFPLASAIPSARSHGADGAALGRACAHNMRVRVRVPAPYYRHTRACVRAHVRVRAEESIATMIIVAVSTHFSMP